ncbi:MAG: hydroxyethylthiazole kinase, partial [Actinomycetota bacterium]
TSLRTDSAHQLLNELEIDVIRANAAEVSILAGFGGKIKGVESVGGAGDTREVARSLASERGCVVAITGKEDIISDGKRLAVVGNGDAMLSTITGTGCMATTVIGGFCAVNKDCFEAAIGGLVVFGLAGEKAAATSQGKPGTFHVSLYDSLSSITVDDIYVGCKVEVEVLTRELLDGS